MNCGGGRGHFLHHVKREGKLSGRGEISGGICPGCNISRRECPDPLSLDLLQFC